MSLTPFHPVLQRWFSETIGTPTTVQLRGWEAIRERRHTLIAAPTGSGKTLAAFLTALDELYVEGLNAPLPDEVRVVYISPLKALSADIHKNLAEPRRGIKRIAEEMGLEAPGITAAVRTGDTTSSERAAMLRKPPHILVTTPESLYLLLTAERSRDMLRTARTVIVDEIHAVIGTRRGAHLAITLERLQRVAEQPLLRLGLSATQKPIEEVAKYLAGVGDCVGRDYVGRDYVGRDYVGRTLKSDPSSPMVELESPTYVPRVTIIDEGHKRAIDLAIEIPRSDIETVMSNEVWEDYYNRLTQLITEHKTTLVFVNTRRMAERVARHLSDRLGEEAVTAHHGSLSKEKRLDAESRLKNGRLKALVATASLELGIDIGHVDLVCQIASPHRIATLLQRVGRSGHTISGLPKGRLFPISRDDLIECAALLREVRRGSLDRIVTHDAPLDVLAQQIVAETSCDDYGEDELFALMSRAWPYRDLSRKDFDEVLAMVAEGFATKRGRRGALVHRDEVNHRVRGRRGSRMLAITSGGAIPEVADYKVVLEPDDTVVGTLNEDFAIESTAGDIFQLGNASWLITQVISGTVRVADAKGAPPTIPFWLGEAPARSDELSKAVSDLRADVARIVESGSREPAVGSRRDPSPVPALSPLPALSHREPFSPEGEKVPKADEGAFDEGLAILSPTPDPRLPAAAWLIAETGLPESAATDIVNYLTDARNALGAMPTQDTIVLERFFDESGGMQLILHAPFGSRINKAWGLALRKRFCRQFNFELQAAATEDAVLLSLGPQHSFPLADVFRYLHPATARDVLVQAMLAAPVFQTRWRWNTTISLAIPRNRGGRKVPPPLQRAMADDLMAAVFPDAAACPENLPGDRELPDHPLVNQVVRDCLEEAMDFDGLASVLTRIHAGEIECIARDTTEPSPLAYEILNAKPYAFLDDAPLEERRTQAVMTRRSTSNDLGALDPNAIERVRDEARPDPRDADELHDALLTFGFLLEGEVDAPELFTELAASRRATFVQHRQECLCHIQQRGCPTHEYLSAKGGTNGSQTLLSVPGTWIAAERLPELLAIHPSITPDITAPASRLRDWSREDALVEIIRGRMSLLGPTTASDLATSINIDVKDADAALLKLESEGAILRGSFTRGATAVEWCDRRLLARIHRYTLNRLRAEIEPVTAADFMRFLFSWQHVAPPSRLTGIDGLHEVIRQLDGFEIPANAWEKHILPQRIDRYEPSLLDTLCFSGDAGWARLTTGVALFPRQHTAAWLTETVTTLSEHAQQILDTLRARGASFSRDLGDDSEALGELVTAGLITSDGFIGRKPERAGRWAILSADIDREEAVETQARALLKRYGVIFRRLLTREPNAAPWRELARIYRRLEARGEIRGGRFVTGMSGEQFALPDAVEKLREIRRTPLDGHLTVISACDPLNLIGILTTTDRIRAIAGTRIAYRDGIAVSVMEGDFLRPLAEPDMEVAMALAGRRVPVAAGFVGRTA